jgi:hypothetical protein
VFPESVGCWLHHPPLKLFLCDYPMDSTLLHELIDSY